MDLPETQEARVLQTRNEPQHSRLVGFDRSRRERRVRGGGSVLPGYGRNVLGIERRGSVLQWRTPARLSTRRRSWVSLVPKSLSRWLWLTKMRCCGDVMCQYLLIGSFDQIMDKSIVEYVAMLVKMRNGFLCAKKEMFMILRLLALQASSFFLCFPCLCLVYYFGSPPY